MTEAIARPYKVTIVIPTFNEEKTIRKVLEDVFLAIQLMEEHCEVIVVNDSSTDNTLAVLKEIASRLPLVILSNTNGRGKGGALRTGFSQAQGKCIVMMDGDGSHQAKDIPHLVEEQQRTNGLVIASRIYGGSEEYTFVRAFGNIFLTWLFGVIHGRYLSDALNGFKAFSADIYNQFTYTSNGYEIEIELLVNTLRCGKSITEVPSLELKRQGGEVKSRVMRDGFKFLWRIILERFNRKAKTSFPRTTTDESDAVNRGASCSNMVKHV